MSTWNRKARAEMGKLQATFDGPKRRVWCMVCDKEHDSPVCKTAQRLLLEAARTAAKKKAARRENLRKTEARDLQYRNLAHKAADRRLAAKEHIHA